MISKLANIDALISKDKYVGINFNKLKATFTSNSKSNITMLENVLRSDNVHFFTKREFLGKWILTMEIAITDKYDEVGYQQIIGKFFLLASRSVVNLKTIGLLG